MKIVDRPAERAGRQSWKCFVDDVENPNVKMGQAAGRQVWVKMEYVHKMMMMAPLQVGRGWSAPLAPAGARALRALRAAAAVTGLGG